MQRQKIFLIVGVVLAVIVAFMVKGYIDQQRAVIEDQAKKAVAQIQANQAVVLIAKRDLPKGTVLEAAMLETAIVPNEYVQPQAVSTLDRVSGMIVVAPFSKNEQVTLSKLSSQQQAGGTGGGSLAMATPIGKRAITISVDNISSLLGMAKPGDYVDVIGLIPVPMQTADGKTTAQTEVLPLFQNVLVLAVGQNTGGPSGPAADARYKKEGAAAEISPYITLALAPQEASLIAFVQEQGKIRLTLRSPADSQIQPVVPAGWDALFRQVTPQSTDASEDAKKLEIDTGGYSIDIYRGLNKERIPVK